MHVPFAEIWYGGLSRPSKELKIFVVHNCSNQIWRESDCRRIPSSNFLKRRFSSRFRRGTFWWMSNANGDIGTTNQQTDKVAESFVKKITKTQKKNKKKLENEKQIKETNSEKRKAEWEKTSCPYTTQGQRYPCLTISGNAKGKIWTQMEMKS